MKRVWPWRSKSARAADASSLRRARTVAPAEKRATRITRFMRNSSTRMADLSLPRHGGAAATALVWRRCGLWPLTVAFAYVCFVPLLLVATRGLHGFVDGARCALVLPLLVVLWRLGPRYRPWAAYATAVVAFLIGSGLMQSFGRQSLYAFPIFWAIGEGPAWLRSRPLLALGFAVNLGLALLLTRFAP